MTEVYANSFVSRDAVFKELKDCKEEALSDIRKLLGFEMEPLFTLDLPNFEENRTMYHEKLLKQCASHLGDTYHDELTVMSTVQAYFHVASKVRPLPFREFTQSLTCFP